MNGIIQILYLLRVHGSFIPPHGTSCHPCRGTQWMRARDLPKHQSSVAIAGAFMLDTLRCIRGIQLQLMTTNRDDHSTLELNAISRMYTPPGTIFPHPLSGMAALSHPLPFCLQREHQHGEIRESDGWTISRVGAAVRMRSSKCNIVTLSGK